MIEALENWWSCVGHGGMSLEQFATFRLVVSIAASIQAEIENKSFSHSYPAADTEQT